MRSWQDSKTRSTQSPMDECWARNERATIAAPTPRAYTPATLRTCFRESPALAYGFTRGQHVTCVLNQPPWETEPPVVRQAHGKPSLHGPSSIVIHVLSRWHTRVSSTRHQPHSGGVRLQEFEGSNWCESVKGRSDTPTRISEAGLQTLSCGSQLHAGGDGEHTKFHTIFVAQTSPVPHCTHGGSAFMPLAEKRSSRTLPHVRANFLIMSNDPPLCGLTETSVHDAP